MELREFEIELERRIGRPARMRPFVCDGSPLSCEAFIVGHNPATEMTDDFWQFWNSQRGFDKEQWSQAYMQQRRARGMARPTNTRARIERVVAHASVRCLETNVHATEAPSIARLQTDQEPAGLVEFLLRSIRPSVVVTHGVEARSTIGNLLGTALPDGQFAAVRVPWGQVQVRAEPHFAIGYSYARAEALGSGITEAARA